MNSEASLVLKVRACFVELGTRQHYRDNVTMFSGQKVVGYCILIQFIVTTSFRHRDLNIFYIFFRSKKLNYIVASFVAAKLKICHVPSSACVLYL